MNRYDVVLFVQRDFRFQKCCVAHSCSWVIKESRPEQPEAYSCCLNEHCCSAEGTLRDKWTQQKRGGCVIFGCCSWKPGVEMSRLIMGHLQHCWVEVIVKLRGCDDWGCWLDGWWVHSGGNWNYLMGDSQRVCASREALVDERVMAWKWRCIKEIWLWQQGHFSCYLFMILSKSTAFRCSIERKCILLVEKQNKAKTSIA